MTIERHFLGWDGACLERAAAWLLDRCAAGGAGEADLRGVAAALPGARAGRRLEELLIKGAEGRGVRLVPPTVVTVGALPDLLVEHAVSTAGDVARQLAWASALRELGADVLRRIVPHPPERDDLLGWAALAEPLDRLHRELAGEGLSFAEVGERGARLADFSEDEADRWRALASLGGLYVERLDAMGLADPQRARWEAVESGPVGERYDRLVLIAAADINALQRRAIERFAGRITALIHAPPDRGDWFDGLGGLIPEKWSAASIELDEDQLRIADRPADQAAAVADALADLGGRFAAEQVTVGVCDESVAIYIEEHVRGCSVPVRHAAGLDMGRTRPFRLLAAAADWLDRGRFADFATLIRHPDVERRLIERAGGRGDTHAAVEDWLSLMDRYYNDHLQARLTGEWLGERDRRRRLKGVHDAVCRLMGKLADAGPRPIGQWAQPIVELLVAVYGREPLDRRDPAQRLILESCDRLRDVLGELHELPAMIADPAGAADAIRLLLRHAERRPAIPPEPIDPAVEMLGPLELQLDDAPVLLVTGFNEGYFPASVNADPFLPDSLRRHLGMLDNGRRYARDAYALTAMVQSRPEVTLIAGRRDAAGDPLAPSRLMFACDDATTARRVDRFFGREARGASAGPAVFGRLRPGRGASDFLVPRPPSPLPEPITSLSVTAFRDYIACPYRFYLRHVLRLEAVDDRAEELDGGAFGTLAHRVLCDLALDDAAASADARAIARCLSERLDDRAREMYGNAPPPAVHVQVEQLRRRLRAFAEWQAAWAGQGWRIRHAELAVTRDDPAEIEVDGEPFHIRGKIDRIDINETTGEQVIFDYKTGDTATPPDKTHRRKDRWIDLQLPLYRHLARRIGVEGNVALGYIVLPKDVGRVCEQLADWDADALAEADEAACEVVRGIRGERFYPPVMPPPAFAEAYAAICQDGGLGAAVGANGGAAGEGDEP